MCRHRVLPWCCEAPRSGGALLHYVGKGEGPEEGHKDDQRAGAPPLGRQVEEAGLFHLFYLKGAYKQEGSQLFIGVDNGRTRGNGFKLKERRFRLSIRGKFFTKRAVRCWNRLPREVVDAPSLEVFKARLDGALGNLI